MAERILIIEEGPAARSGLLELLALHGYQVAWAPWETALNVISQFAPELILLELASGAGDCLEICRQAGSASGAMTPIICVVDRNSRPPIVSCLQAGAADCLFRPLDPEGVMARLHVHLKIATRIRLLNETNLELASANRALDRKAARQRLSDNTLASLANGTLSHARALEPGGAGIDLSQGVGAGGVESLPLNLEQAEALLIQRALAQSKGNVAKAARLLGINRTRIYRRFPGFRAHAGDTTESGRK